MIFLGLRINPRYFVRSSSESDSYLLIKRKGDDLAAIPKDMHFKYIETNELRLGIFDLIRIKFFFRNISSECLYVFETTTFLLLSARQISKVKVLEIGDLLYLNYRFRLIYEVIFLTRLKRNKNILLVVTSVGFKKYLLSKGVENTIEVVENIPRFALDFPSLCSVKTKTLILGYVGIFRYLKNYRYVLSLQPERLNSALYGKSSLAIPQDLNYYGTFQKHDIAEVYRNIHINFIYYSGRNEKLLTPNKFHESILFLVPMIISDESWLADLITEERIGISMTGVPEVDRERLSDLLINYNNYKKRIYEYRTRNSKIYCVANKNRSQA
jgi:hypothetical protein